MFFFLPPTHPSNLTRTHPQKQNEMQNQENRKRRKLTDPKKELLIFSSFFVLPSTRRPGRVLAPICLPSLPPSLLSRKARSHVVATQIYFHTILFLSLHPLAALSLAAAAAAAAAAVAAAFLL